MKIITLAIIQNAQGQVLIARRPKGKVFEGLWEFPGGKREAFECPKACLARELEEELSITVLPHQFAPLLFHTHNYEGQEFLFLIFECNSPHMSIVPREGQKIKWVFFEELGAYRMPPANEVMVKEIQALKVGVS